jgi:hypothetical protein
MALEAVELLSQASHTDLAFEWSMLCQDCTECWTQTGQKETYNFKLIMIHCSRNKVKTLKKQFFVLCYTVPAA